MRAKSFFLQSGIFLFIVGLDCAPAQTASTPSAPSGIGTLTSPQLTLQISPAAQNFFQLQQAFGQKVQSLLNQGATVSQIQAWQQENTSTWATFRQAAFTLASQDQAVPFITDINIPANASPQLADFLAAKANLLNEDTGRFNAGQLTSSAGSSPDLLGSNPELQSLMQQAATISTQTATAPPTLPSAPPIPPNASPDLKAYLTLRHRLMKAEMQMYGQYANADPSARDAAMVQWRQANAVQFLQLQQMAQSLSPTQN